MGTPGFIQKIKLENFSINLLEDGDEVNIEAKQQMIVHDCLRVEENGSLTIDGDMALISERE